MEDIIDMPEEQSVPNERYLQAYFDRQSNYYIDKYREYTSGDKYSFNVAAFFFGFMWFFYRKLWIEGLLIILFVFGSGLIEGVVYDLFKISQNTQNIIFYVSSLVFGLLWGFLGNYLYMRKADKAINNVLVATDDEEQRMHLLSRKGGISLIPIILVLLLIIVILLI